MADFINGMGFLLLEWIARKKQEDRVMTKP